jgi:SPOR domain/Surface-adhesin protein E
MRFVVTAYAAENTWVYIDGKESKMWSADSDSIDCKGYICRALIKLPATEKEEYTTNLCEYDCEGMQVRILKTTKYDSHGNVISKLTQSRQEWTDTIPETINGGLMSFVCKKANLQQEQRDTDKENNRAKSNKKQISKEGVKESNMITIQVGAFRNFPYAEALAKRLCEKGYKAYIAYPGSEDKTMFYRVCVGQLTTKREAKILSEKIGKAENLETFIKVR